MRLTSAPSSRWSRPAPGPNATLRAPHFGLRAGRLQARHSKRAFALFEVLIGVSIFVVGVLVLGRAVENCINAVALSEDEDRVRLLLANRMAEIQATPGAPDVKKETKIETGYGAVTISQKAIYAGLKGENELELGGINLVTLTAGWRRAGVEQARKIEFYVYRGG